MRRRDFELVITEVSNLEMEFTDKEGEDWNSDVGVRNGDTSWYVNENKM